MKLVDSVISIGKILVKSRKTNFHSWRRSNNKPVVIIGNGPSGKNQLAYFIKNREQYNLFAVNKFAISEYFSSIKPNYYVFLDGDFFNFSESIFKDASKHPRISIKPEFLNWQQQINDTWLKLNAVNWPMTLFVPIQYKNKFIVKQCQNPNLNILFFNYTVCKGFDWLNNYFYKLNLGMPQSQNVINSAIYISLTKISDITYLIGLDHDFRKNLHVTENNQLIETVSHIYSNSPFSHPLVNAHTGLPVTLSETFLNLHKLHKSYLELKRYSTYLKKSIYNLTPGGYVDTFERKSIETLANQP